MRTPTAVIVGAGIGGLTTALAFHRRDWRVRLLERAPSLEPIGTAIALAPNALRALATLDVELDDLAQLGGVGGIRKPDGRWLMRANLDDLASEAGAAFQLFPRPALVERLASELPADAVRLGTEVSDVTDVTDVRREPETVVRTAGGEEYAGDLVIAADGIRSRIRGLVFPEHPGPRYAGYTSWRMIVPAPTGGIEPAETIGAGSRFAVTPMTGDRAYCYGTANLPAGERHEDEAAALRSRFGDWHRPIPEIVAAARPDQVLRHDIEYLAEPLPAYHRGRIALLGDAAHAMTPDIGQGGCQAIEDAVVLAHHVATTAPYGDAAALGRALGAYTADRLPRTQKLVRRARSAGRFMQLEAPILVALRAGLLRLASLFPDGLMSAAAGSVHGWQPPASSAPPAPPEQPARSREFGAGAE